jgi:tetratricopeptide (TPR) repeat protein
MFRSEDDRAQLPIFPGSKLGRFEILGEIGRGGFGAVFEARDPDLGRSVAIKVVRPGRRSARLEEWLTREARHAARLSHPNIVQVHDLGWSEVGPYLVMELLRGSTLRQVLAERRLERREALERAREILCGVAHAHANGVVHRDLKPENVFVATDGQVKVLDFGLSHLVEPGSAGTPGYMAPEQARGEPSDERADVFALGAMIYEMWEGRRPFEVRGDVTAYRPPLLQGIPRPLAGLIAAMLDGDLSVRPRNAGVAASALEDARRELSSAPSPRTVRRRLGVAILEPSPDRRACEGLAASFGGRVLGPTAEHGQVVFDPTEVENPVRAALRFSLAAVSVGRVSRAVVDFQEVTALAAGGDVLRYVSPGARHRAMTTTTAPGVYVSRRVAELLSLADVDSVSGHDLVRVDSAKDGASLGGPQPAAFPLVGRQALLAELSSLAAAAVGSKQPTVVAVIGAGGLGCSRLESELAALLLSVPGGPSVVRLAADEPDRPDGGLPRLLRAVLRPPEPPPAATAADSVAALRPLGFEGEAALGISVGLGWLSADAPELASRAAAPGALHSLAVRSAGAALRHAAAQGRGLAVLLDDAHRAGAGLLDALEHAALAEAGAPLFVCAFGRPEFGIRRPGWGERAARSEALQLEPLSADESAELCRALLQPARNITTQALQALTDRAGGVPQLLVALVEGLRREGLVRRDPATGAWTLLADRLDRMPELPVVDWLADRELDRLPPGLTPAAQVLALLGDGVAPGELAGVLAELQSAGIAFGSAETAEAPLRRLCDARLVVEHEGRFQFALPLVREAVARAVPEGLRRAVREAACRFYESAAEPGEEARLTRFSRHAAAVGRHEEAGLAQLTLAALRRASGATVSAEAAFTRALEQLPPDRTAERQAALRGRGTMRFQAGREHDAVNDLLDAAAIAAGSGDTDGEIQCLLDAATACDWLTDYGRSREFVDRARGIVAKPSPRLQARLALGEGRSLFRSSRWSEACLLLESASERALALGPEGYETRMAALILLASALPTLGRVAEAEAALMRARTAARACGDINYLAGALINGRNLLLARGDLPGAIREQGEAIALAREAGSVSTEYKGRYNTAEMLYQSGQVGHALSHLLRAAQIESDCPDLAAIPMAQLLWARLELVRGDVDAARTRLTAFWSGLRRAQALTWRRAELGPAEVVLVDMVEMSTRDAGAEEWADLLERSRRSSIEQEPIEVLEMRARAALRHGDADAARAALGEAERLATTLPNLFGARLAALRAAAGW